MQRQKKTPKVYFYKQTPAFWKLGGKATKAEGTGLEPATPYGAHHFQ